MTQEDVKIIREIMNSKSKGYAYVYPLDGSLRQEYLITLSPENMANFIGKHRYKDVRITITDMLDRLVVNTIGGFLDNCPDQELCSKIQDYLVPIQMEEKEVGNILAVDRDTVDKYFDEENRTLTFRITENLFQKITDYLHRNNITRKAFVTGLIEKELEHGLSENQYQEVANNNINDVVKYSYTCDDDKDVRVRNRFDSCDVSINLIEAPKDSPFMKNSDTTLETIKSEQIEHQDVGKGFEDSVVESGYENHLDGESEFGDMDSYLTM